MARDAPYRCAALRAVALLSLLLGHNMAEQQGEAAHCAHDSEDVGSNDMCGSALLATHMVRTKLPAGVESNNIEEALVESMEPPQASERVYGIPRKPTDVKPKERLPETEEVPKINPEEDANEEKKHSHMMAKYIVAPFATVMLMMLTVGNLLEHYELSFLPDTLVVILVGIPFGFYLESYGALEFMETDEGFSKMVSTILNLVLLPIIVFNGAWGTRRQDFFSQLPYILFFAVFGTIISTSVVGGLIFLTGSMQLHSIGHLRVAMAFASLISATDPVATLTTYSELKVDPLLNILVFGESTVNDAVSIVLFKVLNDNAVMGAPSEPFPGYFAVSKNICVGIVKTCAGSVGIGLILGMIYIFLVRITQMGKSRRGLILFNFMSCYLTFAAAEALGFSGIIATLFCAFFLSVYMTKHLSKDGTLLCSYFLGRLAALADICVFLLVGISVVKLDRHGSKVALWTMLFCLIARATSTVPTAFLCNAFKRAAGMAMGIPQEGWHLIDGRRTFMMWHAGLRGAIALVLALELGDWVEMLDGEGSRRRLQTATFMIICVFLLVFGGTTAMFLKMLDIPTGVSAPPDELSKTEGLQGRSQKLVTAMDKHFFSPILVGHQEHKDFEDETVRGLDIEEVLKDACKRLS